MKSAKAELRSRDIEVLEYYADRGNRELYWNYLAELPGNDGYGRLALGVVRNDNMPGATANAYARRYANEHGGTILSERQWDGFGVDLIEQDLALRKKRFDKGDLEGALNLPGRLVQLAHDRAFSDVGIDPNAWTPRKLLEATRNHGEHGPDDAEKIWKNMLDNSLGGGARGAATLVDMAAGHGMALRERATYAKDMAAAWQSAIGDRAHTDPNVIGRNDHFYGRDRNGEWTEFRRADPALGISITDMTTVSDPKMLRELEDTRALRIQREAARHDFHPDDPGKLIASPHPLADVSRRTSLPGPAADPLYASIRMQLPLDVSDDKVAQMALQARRGNIRHAEELRGVEIQGRDIVCTGARQGSVATLDMTSPAPPMEQSLAQSRQFDAQAQAQQQAMENQARQAVQPLAMHHSGPVMRL